MKIIICTTPIRPVPSDYPPFGSLAVIQALRIAGYDPVFFDIDALRPSFPEVIDRFRQEAPDIIGISAVVSTAYGYVKKLCKDIRRVLPGVKIVLGGNLAASAEILHRFCDIDICAIGEGEKTIVNLANYYTEHLSRDDYNKLKQIKGVTYLDLHDEMVFTGYEEAIPAKDLLDPDFGILERYSNIDIFITDPFTREDFAQDPRSHEPHRAGRKLATVLDTKGCVARCTFCHRWDKGYRQRPPERVVANIKDLFEKYNVGFIAFGSESFGSDRKAVKELIRLVKPLDVLWIAGGVRARDVDLDLLKNMQDAGCVAVYYGFETGSPEILQVMEKKLDLSDNYNAARCTYEAGLYTIYQLVLGMPGETNRTITGTIEMVKQTTEFLPQPPYKYLSINYIQALPGTPVYEYARTKGLIGPKLEDEEEYLLTISDIDAGDDTKFLNFTRHSYLTVQSWRPRLLYESTVHWIRSRSRPGLLPGQISDKESLRSYDNGGYFNLHTLMHNPRMLTALYPIRWLVIWLWTLVSVFRRSPKREYFCHVWELMTWRFRKHDSMEDYRSLRHVMRDLAVTPTTESEKSMIPLRLGR